MHKILPILSQQHFTEYATTWLTRVLCSFWPHSSHPLFARSDFLHMVDILCSIWNLSCFRNISIFFAFFGFPIIFSVYQWLVSTWNFSFRSVRDFWRLYEKVAEYCGVRCGVTVHILVDVSAPATGECAVSLGFVAGYFFGTRTHYIHGHIYACK